MIAITEAVAQLKECPHFGKDEKGKHTKCRGSNCMAWQWTECGPVGPTPFEAGICLMMDRSTIATTTGMSYAEKARICGVAHDAYDLNSVMGRAEEIDAANMKQEQSDRRGMWEKSAKQPSGIGAASTIERALFRDILDVNKVSKSVRRMDALCGLTADQRGLMHNAIMLHLSIMAHEHGISGSEMEQWIAERA